jgi:gluconate:H+ symporter, GntP family
MNHEHRLLVVALVAVIGLVVLIARFRLHAFLALTLAALFMGVCSGMEPPKIGAAYADGVGAVLRGIAAVVGLGTILGKLLAESGGAAVVARTLIRALGERNVPWTMLIVAFIVGIPTWFTVGLVLLIPVLFAVVKETKSSLILLGVPVLAGLSVAHGLVPPHPGPMAAIGTLGAQAGETDVGKVILYGLLIGLPTAALGGPIFARWIARHVEVQVSGIGEELSRQREPVNPPGFGLALFTIVLPILLMLLATLGDLALAKESFARRWLSFIGDPTVAMLAGVLFAYWSFGVARGIGRARLAKFTEECLGPVATVLLVVGAGGGFSRVLTASGVGDVIANIAKASDIHPLVLGWLVAAAIRGATGSATVAITTAAGILVPVALATPDLNLELLVIAMGAGSLILSHVNDGGFWFVKEYFNLTVAQTLRTWTVMETIVSVAGLGGVLLLNALL